MERFGIAIIIGILLAGCATYSKEQAMEMTDQVLCSTWSGRLKLKDWPIIENEIRNRDVNCFAIIGHTPHQICLAYVSGSQLGQQMAYREMERRKIQCDVQAYQSYIAQQQAMQQQAMQKERDLFFWVLGQRSIYQQSQTRPATPPINITCTKMGVFTNCTAR